MGTGERVEWPMGKDFAFTIFDDTDLATLDNVAPVYDFLGGLGLLTTKSVWAVNGDGSPPLAGTTCDDRAYREWTLGLQASGFEIASHGATFETSPRGRVIRSLDRFREIYGHDPISLANHSGCAESIYWGSDRVSGLQRLAYDAMTGFRRRGVFRGHQNADPLFWGDVCRDRIRYVRNFTYRNINTLAACPVMPYHDPERPFVRSWFAGSEGARLDEFNHRVSERNQDRLEAAGGACIMYTHLAAGFATGSRVDARFRQLMERLARKNGWFVPVATLLDFLVDRRGMTMIDARQRRSLERHWLIDKAQVGSS